MGALCTQTSDSFETRFKTKYQFISQVSDHNFGQIKVYRKKQLNYDYIMLLYKYLPRQKLPKLLPQLESLHTSFLKQQQPMALRIFNFDIDSNPINNCTLCLVKIYVEYFNFTLFDLIQLRKGKGSGLAYQELKYVLEGCVVGHRQFLEITGKSVNVCTKSIYLTPDGVIKFSPIRVQEFYQYSTSACATLCNENKDMISLQRGPKYLTVQVKRIFNQLSVLNYQGQPQYEKIVHLFQQIRKCQSVESVYQKIGQSSVQALNLNNKIQGSQNTNEWKDSNGTNKAQSSTSKSSFNEKIVSLESDVSVKFSLTKKASIDHSYL